MQGRSSFIGVILARMDSSRLPRKALQRVAGIPLLGHAIARARRIRGLNELVLATSNRPVDQELCEYAAAKGLRVCRGSADDVAARMLECARTYPAEYMIRINGDSPFLDPELVESGMVECRAGPIDLVTNLIGRTFPYGVSVEIIRTGAFEMMVDRLTQPAEREHPTTYLYEHLSEFSVRTLTSPFPQLRHARLTVDTREDFERFQLLVVQLGDRLHRAGYKQVAELCLAHERRQAG